MAVELVRQRKRWRERDNGEYKIKKNNVSSLCKRECTVSQPPPRPAGSSLRPVRMLLFSGSHFP